ncbi:ectoine synthase [Nonomuraea rubra]|uniref:ectoine synthase n=1 Tax=Nonomuraea rubra TaxID=46180 RepID=UPI00361D5B8C
MGERAQPPVPGRGRRHGVHAHRHDRLGRDQLPLEYRKHLEACYCISGTGAVVDSDGRTHDLEPGTMYALDQNDPHHLIAAPGEDLRLICVFSPALRGDERHALDEAAFSCY